MPWICWRWVSVPISSDKEPQPEPSLRLPFRQESEDMMIFQGYDQQTVDFLWGIRFNNDRSWFQEHKEQYQTHLLAPTRALGEQLYDGLHAMLPHEPLILKVSRIYRDARRLHGQGPYKDHLWLCVRTGDQDWTGRPTFYFEIAPDYYSYGMGFWCAAPALMALYRQRIDADPKPLEKLVRRSTPAARDRCPTSCARGIRKNPCPCNGKPRWTSVFSAPSCRRRFWRASGSCCPSTATLRISAPPCPVRRGKTNEKKPGRPSVCRTFCGAVKYGKNPRNLQKVLEFCQARCYDTTIKRAAKSPWAFYRF